MLSLAFRVLGVKLKEDNNLNSDNVNVSNDIPLSMKVNISDVLFNVPL
jgi:hypothetical protein